MRQYKIKYNSPVVLTFALLSLATLLLNYLTGGRSNALLFMTYRAPLTSPLTWLRMVTHVLGHQSIEHYVNNMLVFLLLGPALEEKYGSRKLLVMIVITAVITAVVNAVVFNSAMLGASGVVFMFILLTSMTSFREKEIPVTFLIILVLYLGQEIINGIFVRDNIAQFAHITGGLIGAVFGFYLKNHQSA